MTNPEVSKLLKRLICAVFGHRPSRSHTVTSNGVWFWRCRRCGADYRPPLHKIRKMIARSESKS